MTQVSLPGKPSPLYRFCEKNENSREKLSLNFVVPSRPTCSEASVTQFGDAFRPIRYATACYTLLKTPNHSDEF